jgi:hypothetical protein
MGLTVDEQGWVNAKLTEAEKQDEDLRHHRQISTTSNEISGLCIRLTCE